MNNDNAVNMGYVGKKKFADWWIYIIMVSFALLCIVPFILVFMISISDEKAIRIRGYSFIPSKFSMAAYDYLLSDAGSITRAYGITILVTIIGTVLSLLIGSMLAYVMSRKDYPYRKGILFFVFFAMLFNGGLVPWYLVYASVLNIKDTIFALIIPNLLLSGFNVLIMRAFFANTIHPALIESAYLDGAGEFRIYSSIILRLSLPVLSAIGLLTTLSYWNDWYNSLIFISSNKLISLQYLMTKALLNIQFLQSFSSGSSDMKKALSEMPSETIRMAMAIVGIGPMLIAYPFFQKHFIRGLTIGAVKG